MKRNFLLLIMTIALLLCGCGSKSDQVDPEMELLSEAVHSYIGNELFVAETLPLMKRYQNAILKAITFDIRSYDVSRGTMEVEFTYIDVLALADSITDPDVQEDDYYAACLEKIYAQEYKTITEVVSVMFEASEDGYVLVTSDELTNVLSGGVLDYYLELLEELGYE